MATLYGNDLLEFKQEKVFKTVFDLNQNGVLEWEDFAIFSDSVRKLRGESSREYEIANHQMRMAWKGILHEVKGTDVKLEMSMTMSSVPTICINKTSDKDLTGKEQVTLQEWKEMWRKFHPQKIPVWQWEYLKYIFFLFDKNGDKKIDHDEYCEIMGLYGIDAESASEAFVKLTSGRSGSVKRFIFYGQFVQLWKEYFAATFATQAGNYLFGLL